MNVTLSITVDVQIKFGLTKITNLLLDLNLWSHKWIMKNLDTDPASWISPRDLATFSKAFKWSSYRFHLAFNNFCSKLGTPLAKSPNQGGNSEKEVLKPFHRWHALLHSEITKHRDMGGYENTAHPAHHGA